MRRNRSLQGLFWHFKQISLQLKICSDACDIRLVTISGFWVTFRILVTESLCWRHFQCCWYFKMLVIDWPHTVCDIQIKSAFVQFFDFSTPISFWCIRLIFLSFPFLNITSIFTTVFLQQFFFQQFFFVTITCYNNTKICQLCRGHVELRKKILWNQTKTRTFKNIMSNTK